MMVRNSRATIWKLQAPPRQLGQPGELLARLGDQVDSLHHVEGRLKCIDLRLAESAVADLLDVTLVLGVCLTDGENKIVSRLVLNQSMKPAISSGTRDDGGASK